MRIDPGCEGLRAHAFLVFRENLHAKDFSTGVDLLSFQILVLSVKALMASYRTYFATVLLNEGEDLAVIQILMNQLLASFSLKLISG